MLRSDKRVLASYDEKYFFVTNPSHEINPEPNSKYKNWNEKYNNLKLILLIISKIKYAFRK